MTAEINVAELQALMRCGDRITYKGTIVRRRARREASPRPGQRQHWSEFQVVGEHGRVLFRAAALLDALRFVQRSDQP